MMMTALLPMMLASAPVMATALDEAPLMAVAADRVEGSIMVTLPAPGADGIAARYIYVSQLETGLGNSTVGLDRGAAANPRILIFRRAGKKVLAEVEQDRFIAPAGSAAQQQSVMNSFASETLWVGEVKESYEDGSFSFDISGFLTRDDMALADAIKNSGAGDYEFAKDLSVADPNFVKVFPENAEFLARLTLKAKKAEGSMRNVAPGNGNVSLSLRHSLIALPEPGFEPRTAKYGYAFGRQKVDYSAPLGAPMVYELANRFRLEKVDPAAERSRVKEPIVFHIDNAAPEPVRSALRDGVDWWRSSFEKAGLVDAFRVEILPEGADPLDVRYNVVNWVNRASRGWSYGNPIHDPRTGEIIKGTVMLGSLRVRQDILIFEALMGAGLTGTGDPNDPIDVALARIRQLGAHEVGHALGFSHNFAASTQGRYSVMDYPAPRVELVDGRLSIADAYGVGTGPWDDWVVDYLYAARNDAEGAVKVAEARAAGLRFISDTDARAPGTAHPQGGLWDDFADPVAELGRMMEVREAALARFNVDAIPAGQSANTLRRAFVPIWLIHRYQVEAAAKSLGGVQTPILLAGEQLDARRVPASKQAEAVDALMATLTRDALTVPERLHGMLSIAPGFSGDFQTDIEVMPTAGGAVFDPLAAAEIAAGHTLAIMLSPTRLNRLEIQHGADTSLPSAMQLVDRLLARAMPSKRGGDALDQRISTTIVLAIAEASRNGALSPTLALAMKSRLMRFGDQIDGKRVGDWQRGLAALLKDDAALDKALAGQLKLPDAPPGMPIG
ncbi:zinc-dependent metalloprotease [Sphingomicrobium flavum]|uniref:zinc-dependent metalloprotease n=1 Tax=Sphingomicrobium flavum TaxID=1229164 RepID=UPI0021AD5330|nr:zinc-dependent metalloprotease [Sphingomicrobium flavum]